MTTSRGETGPMTDPRKQAYLPYLRDLADQMGLKDWSVRIAEDPPENNPRAAVLMVFGRKEGRVHVGEVFFRGTPEDQRADLVHELVHLHFAACDGIASDAIEEKVYPHYNRMREYGIDGIAEAWAPFLPLPPSPERGGKEAS